jgi:hypothetical protein
LTGHTMSCVIRIGKHGKATLDEGPRWRVQWNPIGWEPWIGPTTFRCWSKTKKWQMRLKSTGHHLEGNQLVQTKKQLMIWRTTMQAGVQHSI